MRYPCCSHGPDLYAMRGSSRILGVSLPPTPTSSFRAVCLAASAIAFALGIVVGVTIPLYLLPPDRAYLHGPQVNRTGLVPELQRTLYREITVTRVPDISINTTNSNSESSSQLSPPVENRVHYPSVSFITPSLIPRVFPTLSSTIKNHSLFHQPEASRDKDSHVHSSGNAVSGIYWSSAVEDALPAGFTDKSSNDWRQFTRRSPIVKVEEGCGRMQNRLLTFENGTKTCCRYRQNLDQIQGEIFSFYLGQILGLRNLVPSTLALIRPRDPQWTAVRAQLSLAQWAEDRTVVLTRFLSGLSPAYIPSVFRVSDRRLYPTDVHLDLIHHRDQLIQLAQWSDLIVFDYLTANLDRVVNNLYNLQWNPTMMDAPAHNLARDSETGLLLFFDNESGLLHGYRLLDKYETYHSIMLDALCVFRKSTAEVIKRLHKKKNIGDSLKQVFEESDPEFKDYLPMIPDKSVKILNRRINRVYDQIKKCESFFVT